MTIKNTTQRVEEIALNDVKMCAYQRPTNDRQVANIMSDFDEAKLGMPVVSERGGSYYLLDGNHRVAALRKLNYTSAMFIVLTGMSYTDEAAYFRAQNRNMRPLSRFNLFRAGLEAQDKLCVNIERIVNSHGYKVSGSARDVDAIAAIYTLEVVATTYGFDVLDKTLALLRETWDGVNNATSREFIAGVAEFVKRFGARDFASRMQNRRIATIWQNYLAACPGGNRSANDPAMRKAFCRVLVEHYNKGIPANSKKRLRMEESA